MAAKPTPSLSQVKQWDTVHLDVAARFWSDTAVLWEDAFTQTSREMHWAGHTHWDGAAAGAAQDRAAGDQHTVRNLADRLHEASDVARTGADRIQDAKRGILAEVRAAEDAGFTVGEDFSLTIYGAGDDAIAAAEARGRELAGQIRSSVNELLATDDRVAADIREPAAEVGGISFAEADETEAEHDETIQAVDNRVFKETPPPPPGPINDADDVKRALDPLPSGQKPGVKEAWDNGTMRRLWDYLTRNSTEMAPRLNYSGKERELQDGTVIGLRKSSDGWGDTIDVWYPDGSKDTKVHSPYKPYFPPLISAPPQPPPASGIPTQSTPDFGHAPVARPPAEIFDPNGLPPWLQNPSMPGVDVLPSSPTIMPGVPLPDTPSVTSSVDDFELFPEIGHQLADAGADTAKAVGAAIVIGAAALAALAGVPAGD